ncbi:MAG: hypothetical protein ABIT04_02880 [Novosphingobium sp.]
MSAAHANSLTTDDLVVLSKSGIGDDAIIAKVKNSDTHMNLSVDQMLALKAQGVSGPVIASLMAEARPAAPVFSMDSPDPNVNHPAGVYLLDEPSAKLVRIDAVVTNQAKTGGIIGYALTGGIASMSVKAAIQNQSAKTHSVTRRPAFYFFFDESNAANGAVQATWAAGTAATVTSPGEFTLVRLIQKSGRRQARVGSVNLAGAKTGVMDSDRLAFDYTLVRPGVFRVVPTTELTPGEYGFIYSVAGGGAGGAVTARIFDFAV